MFKKLVQTAKVVSLGCAKDVTLGGMPAPIEEVFLCFEETLIDA